MNLEELLKQRESILTELGQRVHEYEKKIRSDPAIKDEFKVKKINEFRTSVENEYRAKLSENEKSFVELANKGREQIGRDFDLDVHLQELSFDQPTHQQARYQYQSNILKTLDYLPTAQDFMEFYSKAAKSNDQVALNLLESLRNGIISKYKNEGNGYPAEKIKSLMDDTRSKRLGENAYKFREGIESSVREFSRLNKLWEKGGFRGVTAYKEAREHLAKQREIPKSLGDLPPFDGDFSNIDHKIKYMEAHGVDNYRRLVDRRMKNLPV